MQERGSERITHSCVLTGDNLRPRSGLCARVHRVSECFKDV